MDSPRSLACLPIEILIHVFSYLSDYEILCLPISVLIKGLTSAAIARYSTFVVTLDYFGIQKLRRLSSIPFLASAVKEIIILPDRVIIPDKDDNFEAEFTIFQIGRHLETGVPNPVDGTTKIIVEPLHDPKHSVKCHVCRGIALEDQRRIIKTAAQTQRQIETNEEDLSALSSAFQNMVNLQSVATDVMFSQLRAKQSGLGNLDKANYESYLWLKPWLWKNRCWNTTQKPEDYLSHNNAKRVHVLALKAAVASKRKIERLDSLLGVEQAWKGSGERYWEELSEFLEDQQEWLEILENSVWGPGRYDAVYHVCAVYHVWDDCLQRETPKGL